MKNPRALTAIALMSVLMLPLAGCGGSVPIPLPSSGSSSAGVSSSSASSSSDVSEQGDYSIEEFGQSAWEAYEEARKKVDEFVEHRENAQPVHSKVGEIQAATDNLAVGVLSVEEGPYDYRENTKTTKVTVTMVNLSDKTVTVKASNWDAEITNGTRVDHLFKVYSKLGKTVAESFVYARVSPNAVYTDDLYFKGTVKSVIYEPHWLISAENEYLYWDL